MFITGTDSQYRWVHPPLALVRPYRRRWLVIGQAYSAKSTASLSLQKNHYRAEHWIIVTGTVEITNGEKVLTLT